MSYVPLMKPLVEPLWPFICVTSSSVKQSWSPVTVHSSLPSELCWVHVALSFCLSVKPVVPYY